MEFIQNNGMISQEKNGIESGPEAGGSARVQEKVLSDILTNLCALWDPQKKPT